MGVIYKRWNTYWIEYWKGGQRFRETSGSHRRRDARDLLRIREGHIAEGKPLTPSAHRLRFKDLQADLLNDYRSRGLRTIGTREYHFAHLRRAFEGWRAEEITTDAIRAYTVHRQQGGAANATINRELAALKRAFNLAMRAGKLWHRPYIPMLPENNARQGFFEPSQFQAVRAQLPDHLYGVITFAYYTGWRKGEILSLRWPQVDLLRGEVRLEPGTTKNGDGRVIFLEGELQAVLERQWEHRAAGCDFVFHRRGHRIWDFEKAWAHACEQADHALAEEETKHAGGEDQQRTLPPCQGLLFHDLRRTAVRNMVRAGIPERVAMMITGHKTRSILDRYHIVSEADLREAAWKVAAYNGAVAAEPGRTSHSSTHRSAGGEQFGCANLLKPQS